MLTTEQRIIKDIILAQVASDSGKDIFEIVSGNNWKDKKAAHAVECGYSAKDIYILSAMKLICKSKIANIRFYATNCKEINSKLVYFDIKIDEKYYQVSFHCFDKEIKKFVETSKKSRTAWSKEIPSRQTCILLGKRFGLF